MMCRKCGKVVVKSPKPQEKHKALQCECGSRHLRYDGLLVHDLRRTGVRNLRRLGFAEKTIMEISGHKTNSVFKRYDIVDETDLAEVAAALDRKRQADLAQIRHNLAPEQKQTENQQQQGGTIQ
jgi:hypothetical protein